MQGRGRHGQRAGRGGPRSSCDPVSTRAAARVATGVHDAGMSGITWRELVVRSRWLASTHEPGLNHVPALQNPLGNLPCISGALITDDMLATASGLIASATLFACVSSPHDALTYGIFLVMGAWCRPPRASILFSALRCAPRSPVSSCRWWRRRHRPASPHLRRAGREGPWILLLAPRHSRGRASRGPASRHMRCRPRRVRQHPPGFACQRAGPT